MIRNYLQTLRPFLQSTRTAVIRGGGQKDAPGILELLSLRRAFSSISQQPGSLRTSITRYRPRLSNNPSSSSSYQSPLRTKQSKRSIFRSSRLRDSKTDSSSNKTTKKTKSKTDKQEQEQKPLGLSARLKKLSREYGWSAVGVYFALSVLDFPFCFLLVRVVGTDRIGAFEHFIVSHAKKVIPQSVRDKYNEYRAAWKGEEEEVVVEGGELDRAGGWGVEEAEERNKSEASLGTQLALAYAIHKSFIFLRVPLTAAVTPKVVKVLRSWGWDIGKRRAKRGVSP